MDQKISTESGLIRIPSVYSLHRSHTGRIASGSSGIEKAGAEGRKKVQQMQNVPKKIRNIFVAPAGRRLIGADWAAVEWVLTMHFCAELDNPPGFHEDILARFRQGLFDPHRYLASIAYGKREELVTKEERESVKPFTHGRSYLGAAPTLGRKFGIPDKTSYLVCEAHEPAFRVKTWQQHLYEETRRRHFVETPLGWRRYFWGWKPKITEVLGQKVQSTASDLLKWVLVRMFKDWRDPDWHMWTTTHDSVVLESSGAASQHCKTWVRESFEQPIPWLRNRSFRADVTEGQTWKELG